MKNTRNQNNKEKTIKTETRQKTSQQESDTENVTKAHKGKYYAE